MAILTFLLALAHQDVTKQRTVPPAAPARSIDNDEASPIEHVPIVPPPPIIYQPPAPVPMPSSIALPPPPSGEDLPAPPSPPPPRIRTPLRPATPPQGWVIDGDYPAVAVRENMQGVVGFALDVDMTGRPTACTITRSSGWTVLDRATCALIMRRARFHPATDAQSNAVPARFSSRFRWALPTGVPIQMTTWARTTRFTVDPKGVVRECVSREFGAAPGDDAPCASLREGPARQLTALRNATAGPQTFTLVETHRAADQLLARFTMPVGATIYAHETQLVVGDDGYVRGCTSSLTEGQRVLTSYVAICAPGWTYAADPRGFDARRVAMSVTVLRTP